MKQQTNRKQKNLKIWKVVRCQSELCSTIHNRDINANKNMQNIIKHIIENKKRPEIYTEQFYVNNVKEDSSLETLRQNMFIEDS